MDLYDQTCEHQFQNELPHSVAVEVFSDDIWVMHKKERVTVIQFRSYKSMYNCGRRFFVKIHVHVPSDLEKTAVYCVLVMES